MELKESGEMYLETILVLSKTQQNVRSLDIARYMHAQWGSCAMPNILPLMIPVI